MSLTRDRSRNCGSAARAANLFWPPFIATTHAVNPDWNIIADIRVAPSIRLICCSSATEQELKRKE